jgi:short-subunit dehydrogenase
MKLSSYVIITGASAGIGKALAYEYAKSGYNLLLIARRKKLLEEIATDLSNRFSIITKTLECDLLNPDCEKLIENFCNDQSISIHTFINNAGLGYYEDFIHQNSNEVNSMISLNIQVLTHLSHFCLNYWKKNNLPGKLINIASIAAYVPLEKYAVYAATKAYVKSFSQSLNLECEKYNIHVSCVCPGGTKTDFFQVSGQTMTTMGEKMMMSSEACARIIYQDVQKGKMLIVPGLSNKLTILLSKFLPELFLIRMSTVIYNYFMKK